MGVRVFSRVYVCEQKSERERARKPDYEKLYQYKKIRLTHSSSGEREREKNITCNGCQSVMKKKI